MVPSPQVVAEMSESAARVEFWWNRIQRHRRELMNHHQENINSITGCLKQGVLKWKFEMHEALIQADLAESQREFNNASVAYGSLVRAAMNGQSLKRHEDQKS